MVEQSPCFGNAVITTGKLLLRLLYMQQSNFNYPVGQLDRFI